MPSISEKIRILGAASKYDICASMASPRTVNTRHRIGSPTPSGICHAFTPDGRCISLFKVLMSNYCSYDCKYCVNSSISTRRKATSFKRGELARAFIGLYTRNYVEGLFLSSGVLKDPDRTTELMIDELNYIRDVYHFRGYMHIKILPGTSDYLIKQIMEKADRVSINLEVPDSNYLNEICSTKNFNNDILRCQRVIRDNVLKGLTPSGHSTQFVVGAAGETDRDILKRIDWEYKTVKLKRAYFSAFNPLNNTPFVNQQAEKHEREVQLYRVDWLLRRYKYKLKTILNIINEEGRIPLFADPKYLIAVNDDRLPLDVNTSSYDELLLVPGIGEISARRIVNLRKEGQKMNKYRDLRRIGVAVKRAKPFLIVNGKREALITQFF